MLKRYDRARRAPAAIINGSKQPYERSLCIGRRSFCRWSIRSTPYDDNDLRQLSVSALVTNRDLPTLLPNAPPVPGEPLWRLEPPGPVSRVTALRQPTRPVTRRPVGDVGWSLVNHLALNHLALVGETPQRAAVSLRMVLMRISAHRRRHLRLIVDGISA